MVWNAFNSKLGWNDFATPTLEKLVGPVFNHIAKTFIDAFVKRAESVYSPSKT